MLLSCVCPRGGSLFFSPLILSSIIPHTRPLSTEAKGGERGESEREGEEDESQGLKMKMMGDEMREMEVKFRRYLKPDQGFIVRLDGCSFSKFTRDFEKPFDHRIGDAMKQTTSDLLTKFQPVSAYTSSDEISLVFPPPSLPSSKKGRGRGGDGGGVHVYAGNVIKIVSVMASYCGLRFIENLKKFEMDEKIREKIVTSGAGHFDARAFSVKTPTTFFRNLQWRALDARRNSKSLLGRKYMPQKRMNNMSSARTVQILKEEFDVDWNEISDHFKSGTFFKCMRVEREGKNFRTGEKVPFLRRLPASSSWDILEENNDLFSFEDLLFAKNVNDVEACLPFFQPFDGGKGGKEEERE